MLGIIKGDHILITENQDTRPGKKLVKWYSKMISIGHHLK